VLLFRLFVVVQLVIAAAQFDIGNVREARDLAIDIYERKE
jgi:hypothetical protein